MLGKRESKDHVLRSPEPFDLAVAQLAATAETEADASIHDTRQDTVL